MKQSLVKETWLVKALETNKYYIGRCRDNPKQTLSETAKELKRSTGSISEDLLIASWYKTHSIQLEKFDYAKDALKFIRERHRYIKLDIS